MEILAVLVGVLWLVVVGLVVAVWALARQVGILLERVSPLGALMIDAGPAIGTASPRFELTGLSGERITIGGKAERSRLLFFLSPTCPVCKKLLPVLRSVQAAESSWLEVILASDGERQVHERFIEVYKLHQLPYVLSAELGMAYRVSRLPFGVLLGEDGVVKAKGLVNNREQLESLFSAKELGVASMQDYFERSTGSREISAASTS